MEGIIYKIPLMMVDFTNKHGIAPDSLLVGPDHLTSVYHELEYIANRKLVDIEYKEIKKKLFGLNLIRTKDEYFAVVLGAENGE